MWAPMVKNLINVILLLQKMETMKSGIFYTIELLVPTIQEKYIGMWKIFWYEWSLLYSRGIGGLIVRELRQLGVLGRVRLRGWGAPRRGASRGLRSRAGRTGARAGGPGRARRAPGRGPRAAGGAPGLAARPGRGARVSLLPRAGSGARRLLTDNHQSRYFLSA